MKSTAEVIALQRRRKSLPIPDGCDSIIESFGGETPNTFFDVTYRLKTRKVGVEITLKAGPLRWNLSAMEKVWPADFAAARVWVKTYLARYGHNAVEELAVRPLRAVGDDVNLLKIGGCKEERLDSDVPVLAAEAMSRCQHSGAFCWSDGFCNLGTCDMEMVER